MNFDLLTDGELSFQKNFPPLDHIKRFADGGVFKLNSSRGACSLVGVSVVFFIRFKFDHIVNT